MKKDHAKLGFNAKVMCKNDKACEEKFKTSLNKDLPLGALVDIMRMNESPGKTMLDRVETLKTLGGIFSGTTLAKYFKTVSKKFEEKQESLEKNIKVATPKRTNPINQDIAKYEASLVLIKGVI